MWTVNISWRTNICVNSFWSTRIGVPISLYSLYSNSSHCDQHLLGPQIFFVIFKCNFFLQIFRVYLKSCRWLACYSRLCIQAFNIYLRVGKTLIEILTHFHFTLPFDKSKLLQVVENLHKFELWYLSIANMLTNLHLPSCIWIATGWQVGIWETGMSRFLWNWDLQIFSSRFWWVQIFFGYL